MPPIASYLALHARVRWVFSGVQSLSIVPSSDTGFRLPFGAPIGCVVDTRKQVFVGVVRV